MSDFGFEARLERLFSQPPRLADADAFARRVQARLEREWALRRGLLGAAGVLGGVIAVTQTVGAEVYSRLFALSVPARREFDAMWAQAQTDLSGGGLSMSGEAVWLVAAMGGVLAALAITRFADNL